MTRTPTPGRPGYSTDDDLKNLIGALPFQHQLDGPTISRGDSDLDQLHDFGIIADAAAMYVHRHVRICRQKGHTWSAIGDALGITRQAAQQRFSSSVPIAAGK